MGFIGIVGAYASPIIVDPARLARKPARLSFADAAAIPAAMLTTWQALHEHGGLRKGQRVLIHAAAGGVGSAAAQLARPAGAHVIGIASTGNREYVQGLGAAEVIDYRAVDFAEQIDDVDLVLDLVGGTTQARSWSVLKRGGILVSTVAKPNATLGNEAQATGKHFATRSGSPQLAALAALHASGELQLLRRRTGYPAGCGSLSEAGPTTGQQSVSVQRRMIALAIPRRSARLDCTSTITRHRRGRA